MNILGWHVYFRRSHRQGTSPFSNVLSRVRTIREYCDWQSSTTPAHRERRRERILQARKRFEYHPAAHDTASDSLTLAQRIRLLWLGLPFLLLCVALVWGIATAKWSEAPMSFTYYLPAAPPFLSEQLALDTIQAMQADYAHVFGRSGAWKAIERPDRLASTALDGTRETRLVRHQPTKFQRWNYLFGDCRAH